MRVQGLYKIKRTAVRWSVQDNAASMLLIHDALQLAYNCFCSLKFEVACRTFLWFSNVIVIRRS